MGEMRKSLGRSPLQQEGRGAVEKSVTMPSNKPLFQNTWAVPVLVGEEYRSITVVERQGSKYVLVDLGSTELAGILAARETIAGVSDALDRGRAGLLRVAGEGGASLIAYEAEVPVDALQGDIRVLPLAISSRWFQGLDGSVNGVPVASLAEIDSLLPLE